MLVIILQEEEAKGAQIRYQAQEFIMLLVRSKNRSIDFRNGKQI